jgi:hypothetical protein
VPANILRLNPIHFPILKGRFVLFEVGAERDSSEVFLDEGKQIEVQITLSQQAENLKFYEYDENKGASVELAKVTNSNGTALSVQG